ncbi:MAG: YbaK/EbsC family protein [Gammaproteobacteria bacterium]|nr:YbaK/EbsC family protein [Gammaproteobacteria bacterium]
MTIPSTIMNYVEKKDIDCTIVPHPYSQTSLESAHAANISGECLAKGVLLTDPEDFVLAVLPASHELDLSRAADYLGTRLDLAPEKDLGTAFEDCISGAVPALGSAYGIRTIVDKALTTLPDVYFEAGDHRDLIHVSGNDFRKLMADADCARISEHK